MKMPLAKRPLFFDPAIVADRHKIVKTVVAATKHPANPILPLGDVGKWGALRAVPWASRTSIYFKVQPTVAIAYWGALKFAEAWRIDVGKLGHGDVAPVLMGAIGIVASFFFRLERAFEMLVVVVLCGIPVYYLLESL